MNTKQRNKKVDLEFIGTLGACLEQYIKGRLSKLDILKLLNKHLNEEDKKNWDPKSEFEGYQLIETFLDVKGLTQAELAKGTGLSRSKINDIIKGRIKITPNNARKLAKVFEVEHTVFL